MNSFIEEINNVDEEIKEINPNEGYKLEEDVIWKNLYDEEYLEISGRAIGGCFDLINACMSELKAKSKQCIFFSFSILLTKKLYVLVKIHLLEFFSFCFQEFSNFFFLHIISYRNINTC